MILVPGGTFRLGSDLHYAEERPARDVTVAAFLIAAHAVTTEAFARFVAATGWVTQAERAGASNVFVPTAGPVDLSNNALWWRVRKGADWRYPFGPEAAPAEARHPVTHVAQSDAQAYAAWRGARLPTEWEWEVAARGGLHAQPFCWGEAFAPDGGLMANIWTGMFPWYFSRGAPGPAPVGSFPANGYGLFDMAGNVWERTSSKFDAASCCTPEHGATRRHAARGGSYLCAAEYCLRYRPAARIGIPDDETTCHIGFRLAADPAGPGAQPMDRSGELA